MRPSMIHTAYKVTTSRNAYGDYIASGETVLICHFRYITQVITNNNEEVQSDAMAWFEPDSGVSENDLIKFEGDHFQVEKLVKARRLHQPDVQFIKVYLKKYGVIS